MGQKIGTVEAAKILGVSPDALRDWAQKGVGPPYYQAHETAHRRYDQAELINWLKSKRVGGKDQRDSV